MTTTKRTMCALEITRGGKRHVCTRPAHDGEWHTIYTKRHGYLFVNARGQRRDDVKNAT